jgi:hypothetical protein
MIIMSLFKETQLISEEEYEKLKDTKIIVKYKDEEHEFVRRFYDLRDMDQKTSKYHGKIYFVGYEHRCPKCGLSVLLNNSIHTILIEEIDGKEISTVSPSLVCPHKCGWHVWIKHGIAVDC